MTGRILAAAALAMAAAAWPGPAPAQTAAASDASARLSFADGSRLELRRAGGVLRIRGRIVAPEVLEVTIDGSGVPLAAGALDQAVAVGGEDPVAVVVNEMQPSGGRSSTEIGIGAGGQMTITSRGTGGAGPSIGTTATSRR